VLVKEFGLTFRDIKEMTHLQVAYLLAGWNKEQEMIEKAHKSASKPTTKLS